MFSHKPSVKDEHDMPIYPYRPTSLTQIKQRERQLRESVMDQFKEMIDGPNDDIYVDASDTERRLLIIGLYMSYFVCLAGLWLIDNALGQAHAFIPNFLGPGQQSGNFHFAFLIVPLIVLYACYFKLRCLTGKIMQLPESQLDERQRMVRNRAHRVAYRIFTILCLAILAYLCVHSMLLSASPPVAHSIVAVRRPMDIILVTKGVQTQFLQPQTVHWVEVFPYHPKAIISVAATSSIDLLSMGLYYGLFLVTMFLIVKTLPTAVIGWKERG